MTLEPFDKWGKDFIRSIDPPSEQKKYIIVCINYLTKWVETKDVKIETEEKVVDCLRENVFYKFGYPRAIVIEQKAQFTSHLIKNMLRQHHIKKKKIYFLSSSGQCTSRGHNRALKGILAKVVSSR